MKAVLKSEFVRLRLFDGGDVLVQPSKVEFVRDGSPYQNRQRAVVFLDSGAFFDVAGRAGEVAGKLGVTR